MSDIGKPPPRDFTLALPHLSLAAREWGPVHGPRVLALHGWLDNAASFDRLAPLLEDLRVVAVDLPGHGRSAHRPPGACCHFVDWVADVVAVADVLGWTSFSLLGHSMGAGIAALVPAVMPQRIERLVLVEGLGPLSSPPELAPERLRRAIAEERGSARSRVFPDLEAAVTARMLSSELDRDAARLLVERATEPVAAGVRFVHDPMLKTPSRLRLTEEQVLAFLAAIPCPVLVIRAADGLQIMVEKMGSRVEAIADVQVMVVPGGHHVHLTHPELVAPLVRRFFAPGGRRH